MGALLPWVNHLDTIRRRGCPYSTHISNSELFIDGAGAYTIVKVLFQEKFTLKEINLIPIARNIEENKNIRFYYWLQFQNYLNSDQSNFIFIDESGFNLYLKRPYRRNKAGIPAITTKGYKKWGIYHLLTIFKKIEYFILKFIQVELMPK